MEYELKAECLATPNFFNRIFNNIDWSEIAELYIKAGNKYKIAKAWIPATKAFITVA